MNDQRQNRKQFRNGTLVAVACAALALVFAPWPTRAGKQERPAVTTIRVPNNGIQPQIATDGKGVLHMVYFTGDKGAGDLYYVRSSDGGATFSEPMKVNSHPGSAIAAGNIRGAHIAIGRNGRVHVAWNGTYELDRPGVTKPWMKKPMVYTRLNDTATAFEPERNVIQAAYGLDGGGAVAADRAGDVYVFWHAPTPGTEGEVNRRVWVARSTNDGKSFDHEKAAFDKATGACGCCGMSAFTDDQNHVYVMYRSATETVHRDIYMLVSTDRGETFQGTDVAQWNIGACTMSMEHFSQSRAGVLSAWETMGNVFYGVVNPSTGRIGQLVAAPGEAKGRKYPVVIGNARGETLLAWTEGMSWGKGGSLVWQIYGKNGAPEGEPGHADGVPPWSLVAAFVRSDSGFTVLY
jgi:hypothetical protein